MTQFWVSQQIHFCYGHRLLEHSGKCAHLHGHNGVVELSFSSPTLDSQGMVVDFSDIKSILKTWIDQTLDHRLLLHAKDPLISILQKFGEPIFVMKENPTAENIARMIFEQAKIKGLPIEQVKLWETPTQYAMCCEVASRGSSI